MAYSAYVETPNGSNATAYTSARGAQRTAVTRCAVTRDQLHRHGDGPERHAPRTGCQRHNDLGDPVRGM
jgi:hypothetical protein